MDSISQRLRAKGQQFLPQIFVDLRVPRCGAQLHQTNTLLESPLRSRDFRAGKGKGGLQPILHPEAGALPPAPAAPLQCSHLLGDTEATALFYKPGGNPEFIKPCRADIPPMQSNGKRLFMVQGRCSPMYPCGGTSGLTDGGTNVSPKHFLIHRAVSDSSLKR